MHTCATCKWRSDTFTSVCCNDESDHLADFVYDTQTCGVWEEKEGDPDDDQGDRSEHPGHADAL